MTAFAFDRMVGRPGLRILRAAAIAFAALVTVMVAGAQASTGKRVALVIGNSAYQHAPQLANPANDATDMAGELRSLGFVVVEGTDLTNRGMRDKIREFASELRGADVGMLYYAGHGLQVNGRNYLAPVDAKLEFESDLDFETIPLQFIERQMDREVKTVLLFLDACRDNPLTRSFRTASRSSGAGKGLAEVKSAPGTLIAFSTDPNNVALDGKGRNSPFTQALLKNIDRPNIEIQTMMTDVRQEVYEETGQQQTPWINSSLLGRFYFAPGSDSAGSEDTSSTSAGDSATPKASSSTSSNTSLNTARIEREAWDAIKDSKDPGEVELFISSYGSGFYGKLARLKLQRLKKSGEAVASDSTDQNAASSEDTKLASLEQADAKQATRKIEPQLDPRQIVLGIQQELSRLSCNPGQPDGIWGRRSQGALDNFRRSARVQLASASPDADLLNQLKDYDGKGCPVARSCPSGQRMSSRGVCYTPRQQARGMAPTQQPRSRQVIVQQPPQQQVIVQQPPQQVIVQQPVQRRVSPLGVIGGIAVGIGVCRLAGGC